MPDQYTSHQSEADATSQADNERIDIIRGKVPNIKIYDVTEEELINLEQGRIRTIFLMIALPLFFSGVSITVACELTQVADVPDVVNLLMGGCYASGIAMFIVWLILRKNTKDTLKKIRERIEHEKLQEAVAASV